MKFRTPKYSIFILLAYISTAASIEFPQSPLLTETSFIIPEQEQRHIVLISDLHIGLGKDGETWLPTEDFRWPNALKGLLDEVSKQSNHNTDLIIVGDFLEFWQPPTSINCIGINSELGCTIEEMEKISKFIVSKHQVTFKSLRKFSSSGNNRIHIIPGNHDAALVLARIWAPLAKALNSQSGKINFVNNGIWESPDGRIIVEHGHQIGSDVNKYNKWPVIFQNDKTTGKTFIKRTWGEQFVQKLFNEQENNYPIIDNLSPETVGARYRMSDRGIWGTIEDIGKFIAFNLWETSLEQKIVFLGNSDDKDESIWDIERGRKLGYKLFSNSLPLNDPFRKVMLDDSEDSEKLRGELNKLALDKENLSDTDIILFCNLIALRESNAKCQESTLSATVEKMIVPRKSVIESHLKERRKTYPRMNIFIYGHTHLYEDKWSINVTDIKNIEILNTGAFQRVINEEQFNKLIKERNLSPQSGLKTLTVDDLPPCYTAVIVEYKNNFPEAETLRWHMPENKAGKFISTADSRCN